MTELRASKNFAFSHWKDDLILPGNAWDPTIQDALHACDFVLVKGSPALFTSNYVLNHEIPHFVGPTAKKPCFPVFLTPLDFRRYDLAGMDRLQFFGLSTPQKRDTRAFSECSTDKLKGDFARQLATRIEAFCAQLP